MSKTKVLILHTSETEDAAENIYEKLAASESYMPRLEVFPTLLIERLSNFISNHITGLWGFLYFSKIVIFFTLPLRKLAVSFYYKQTLELLREFQPAMVISTHATASAVIASLKSKSLYHGKLVIAFSDYHLHKFWLYKEADLYLCSIAEQEEELKRLGIAEEKIVIIGIIISDRFLKEINREEVRSRYSLLNSTPVVLLVSGTLAHVDVKEVFLSLLRSSKVYQIVVVTGRNEKLKSELEKISAPTPHPVKILGKTADLEVLMSSSDVLVGQIVGSDIAYAVIKKLPMVLTNVQLGSEVANLEYLLRHKIVEYGRIAREVVFLVVQNLNHKIKQDWEQAYNKIIKPKNSQSLLQALSRANDPEAGLSVKNYQEVRGG